MLIVQRMQGFLSRLYDLDAQCDVADYLITDRRHLRGIHASNDSREIDEQLLIAESRDGALLGLYIDACVLERLERCDPLGTLNERNLQDFCTALEGVSHFMYSAWRLRQDRRVSLLELETQAEVDKFAAAIFLLAHQGGRYPRGVFERLFGRVRFDSSLTPEQLQRYVAAHRCAARYCQFLERSFVKRGVARFEALLRELRRFYRLGSASKVEYALAASP